MRLYLLLLLLISSIHSFVILPYVQIDYVYYFRLAQCQSKCTQKYGHIMKKSQNDGSTIEEWDNSSEDMQQCTLGCEQPRKGVRPRSLPNSRVDGAIFWEHSSAVADKTGVSSPISRVSLLCQNVAPADKGGLADSIEGLISVEMSKHTGPIRLLVQWKHRQLLSGVIIDGGSSITASIESSTLFKVEGMQPGIQYLFTVTVIGPNGRIGEAISSKWIEAIHMEKGPEGSIKTKSGYSNENGITTVISWTRAHIDSCYYSIHMKNSTFQERKDITIDASSGILFTNLEMDSEYEISVSASDVNMNPFPRPLHFPFRTLTCVQIHGKGSLQCPPEPVDDIKISIRSNGSTIISWNPSSDSSLILTYEISATPISPCEAPPSKIYINAASTSAFINLGDIRPCEYSIRVTNYDLIGRESYRETRVLLTIPNKIFTSNIDGIIAASLALSVIILLLLICKCFICCRRRNDHQENKKSLVGYV